jgi:hypothetical protein
MPPLFPGALLPWVALQFCDAEGHPLVGGFLWFYEAGTDTPRPVYTDADLSIPHPNPIELDAAGRPPDGLVYLEPGGYKVICTDLNGVNQWTADYVEDVGATFASQFGLVMSQGGKNVTSGYTVLASDRLITVDSAGGPDPCVINLPAAADATQPITIKNFGTIAIDLRPNGADTIDGVPSSVEIPGAVGSIFPTVTLVSNGVSAWYLVSSYGIA